MNTQEENTHYTKCINPHFQNVWDGIKTAEIRFNDRDYKVNDIVYQQEFDREEQHFSGREIVMKVTYVLKEYSALIDGFCMYCFEIIEKVERNENLKGKL